MGGRGACLNVFILLPVNIVDHGGDALLKINICYFYPFQSLRFLLLLEKIIRGSFLFIRLKEFFLDTGFF